MNKIIYTILFFTNSLLCLAQENLVPNGSFEEYVDCPDNTDQIEKAIGWSQANIGTSDYFNSCANFGSAWYIGVPSNFIGYRNANTGNAYAGLISYETLEPSYYCEYLQCKLNEKLIKDTLYYFEMYVSLGTDYSSHGIFNLGVLFSEVYTYNYLEYFLDYSASYTFDTVIIDTTDWVKLSFNYQATGGEEYLIIGKFDTIVKAEAYIKSGLGTYVCIDDVSLTKVKHQLEKINIPNVFTPNNDGINDFIDFSMLTEGEVYIYNRWGNLVYITNEQSNYLWYGKNNFGEDLSDGVYFYIIESENFKKQGYIHLIR